MRQIPHALKWTRSVLSFFQKWFSYRWNDMSQKEKKIQRKKFLHFCNLPHKYHAWFPSNRTHSSQCFLPRQMKKKIKLLKSFVISKIPINVSQRLLLLQSIHSYSNAGENIQCSLKQGVNSCLPHPHYIYAS